MRTEHLGGGGAVGEQRTLFAAIVWLVTLPLRRWVRWRDARADWDIELRRTS